MESGVCDTGIAIARRGGAFLARSIVLQARASRRGGGVASGLFLLDSYSADVAPFMLDRPRRFDARERLRALRAGQSSLGLAANHRVGKRHARDRICFE